MSSLTLALLGPPYAARADGSTVAFRLRKELAILAFLAVEGPAAQPRDSLLSLLWPEASEEAARNNLRVTLANIRRIFDAEHLSSDRQVVRLRLEPGTLDVATFRDLLAAVNAHHPQATPPCATCAVRLERAVAVYRGDFLAGFALSDAAAFEEWAMVRREALHQQALDALTMLAAYYEQRGDYATVGRHARRQLELEPWHELAHRQLMRSLALAGDRDAALTQYERCRRVLAEELGIEPDIDTRALYEHIRTGSLTATTRDVVLPHHHLPAPLTPFIGREAEIAALSELLELPTTRLLTLIGIGGMGKTRLALELARARVNAYTDGVFFVALAPLASASTLSSAIAQALDLDIHGDDPRATLLDFLRNKHVLLICDNFEHLRDGIDLVVELLRAASRVQIIVTSRERLKVYGEHLFVVEGLPYDKLPDESAAPAVRLFAQSARRVQPGFQLDARNLSEVVQVCQLVQGMPLGLELAAAWVELLSVGEIAREIARSASFLEVDWSDMPQRQRSMRAVFLWSWRLLNEVDQQLFRRLAVFRGSFTRETADAVVGASPTALASLVHVSLLRRIDIGATHAGCYEIHELLRQFAYQELAALPDEQAMVEGRHSAFYLGFVAQRAMRLTRHDAQIAAAEIRAEIDNIRQAWQWAAVNMQVDELYRSAYGLWQFYWLTGLSQEGEATFGAAASGIHQRNAEVGAALQQHQRAGLLSRLLAVQALFLNRLSAYDQAIVVAEQATIWGRTGSDLVGEALGYVCWGQALYRKGHGSAARPYIERALDLTQNAQTTTDHEPQHQIALDALAWLGMLAKEACDFHASRSYLTRALALCHTLSKRHEEDRYVLDIGELNLILGDYVAAARSLQAGTRLARESGNRVREGAGQLFSGIVALDQGNYVRASEDLLDALGLMRDTGIRMYEAYALAYLGRLADSVGDYAHARKLLERALDLSRKVESSEAQFQANLFLALLLQRTNEHTQAYVYAKHSQQIADATHDRSHQAEAWVALACIHEDLHDFAEARAAYQQALRLYEQVGRMHMATEARVGLARVALSEGHTAEALAYIEPVMIFVESQTLFGPHEPFRVALTCYQVLQANREPRAASLLQIMQQRLHQCATTIPDDTLRQSYLENVPAHQAILRGSIRQ